MTKKTLTLKILGVAQFLPRATIISTDWRATTPKVMLFPHWTSSLFFLLAATQTTSASSITPAEIVICLSTHCLSQAWKSVTYLLTEAQWLCSCEWDKNCSAALKCNAKCASEPNAAACNLLCELNIGYGDIPYKVHFMLVIHPKTLPDSIAMHGRSSLSSSSFQSHLRLI